MSREAFLSELAAHGIDPTDRKYQITDSAHVFTSGQSWCSWCRAHATERPRAACDLQRAKASEMAADGRPVAPCRLCRDPHFGERGQRCPACTEKAEAADAAIKTHRFTPGTRAVRRDDHCGDVEAVHPVELALLARDGGMGE